MYNSNWGKIRLFGHSKGIEGLITYQVVKLTRSGGLAAGGEVCVFDKNSIYVIIFMNVHVDT